MLNNRPEVLLEAALIWVTAKRYTARHGCCPWDAPGAAPALPHLLEEEEEEDLPLHLQPRLGIHAWMSLFPCSPRLPARCPLSEVVCGRVGRQEGIVGS